MSHTKNLKTNSMALKELKSGVIQPQFESYSRFEVPKDMPDIPEFKSPKAPFNQRRRILL